VKEETRN